MMVELPALLAHGLGGRIDLPIPIWQFAWAAAFAVLVSFAILGRFWTVPHLARASPDFPAAVRLQRVVSRLLPVTRLVGLVIFLVTIYAGLGGSPEVNLNWAPYAAFILVWVGMVVASAGLGNLLWAAFNPFETLIPTIGRFRHPVESDPTRSSGPKAETVALAAIVLFVWMELAYHLGAQPRTIGSYLTLYTLVLIAGGRAYGPAWASRADGFSALFRMVGALAPLRWDKKDGLRLRYPLVGLAHLRMEAGTVRLVLVVLGATTFDGFSRSSLWLDVISNRSGWELTAANTGGLAFGIGLVMALYRVAIAVMSRITGESEYELGIAFGPSLLPIMVAYILAHYFSFLVFEGQNLIRLASDPFGLGSDYFGTAGWQVNYTLVSIDLIAWVQTATIAFGHVLAVLLAHDKAIERFPSHLAVRSQYPMLAAMIAFTIGGLYLLLG